MPIYSVMLEGIDAAMGYFLNIEVAASNPTSAVNLAEARAQELGLTIVAVDEVTETRQAAGLESRVLSVSGKSYFPAED